MKFNLILLSFIETPVGKMISGSVEEGICFLEYSDRLSLNKEIQHIRDFFRQDTEEGDSDHFRTCRSQLTEYFNGARKEFDLSIVTSGSSFQERVWSELMKIPYGTTRSYRQQADALGQPDSIRAVAKANGMNRIAIIIPCHRVIGSDGSLTGYGGGVQRKKWLLDHEKKYSGQANELTLF